MGITSRQRAGRWNALEISPFEVFPFKSATILSMPLATKRKYFIHVLPALASSLMPILQDGFPPELPSEVPSGPAGFTARSVRVNL